MKTNPADEIGIACPRCGTFNPIDSVVCAHCAALLDIQSEPSKSPPQSDRATRMNQARMQVSSQAHTLLGHQQKRSQMALKLVQYLGVAILIVLVILGIWNRIQVMRWEGQIAGLYEKAMRCVEEQDFLCARDTLLTVIDEAPNYPGATDQLTTVRWNLAQQYITEKQWEKAAAELEILMEYSASRPEVRIALQHTYDQRIRQAQERGDLGEALRLSLDRVLKFGL